MKVSLEKAYNKLRTEWIRVKIGDNKWITTHEHQIDEEGDWVAFDPGNEMNYILVVDPNTIVKIHDDHISFPYEECDELIEVKIQFLDSKPLDKLDVRMMIQ